MLRALNSDGTSPPLAGQRDDWKCLDKADGAAVGKSYNNAADAPSGIE